MINYGGSVDLLGCVMDGWWNHHGVINVEVVINMVGLNIGVVWIHLGV